MNGECLMEQACGYYDELHQLLAEDYISHKDIEDWYKKGFITEQQYKFAVNYLKGE